VRTRCAPLVIVAGVLLASTAPLAHAACVALASGRGGAPLALVALDARGSVFRIHYIHSVTRTPVEERYVVEGDRIVQTEIRFEQHGPGLPTAPDEGGTFEQRDGTFIVRGRRTFDRIVMRVEPAQRPALTTAAQTLDLARWGRGALALTASAADCDAP